MDTRNILITLALLVVIVCFIMLTQCAFFQGHPPPIINYIQGQPIIGAEETTVPINCGSKHFICVSDTSFLVCYNNNGNNETIDNIVQKCSENKFCNDNDLYECESTVAPTNTAVAELTDGPSASLVHEPTGQAEEAVAANEPSGTGVALENPVPPSVDNQTPTIVQAGLTSSGNIEPIVPTNNPIQTDTPNPPETLTQSEATAENTSNTLLEGAAESATTVDHPSEPERPIVAESVQIDSSNTHSAAAESLSEPVVAQDAAPTLPSSGADVPIEASEIPIASKPAYVPVDLSSAHEIPIEEAITQNEQSKTPNTLPPQSDHQSGSEVSVVSSNTTQTTTSDTQLSESELPIESGNAPNEQANTVNNPASTVNLSTGPNEPSAAVNSPNTSNPQAAEFSATLSDPDAARSTANNPSEPTDSVQTSETYGASNTDIAIEENINNNGHLDITNSPLVPAVTVIGHNEEIIPIETSETNGASNTATTIEINITNNGQLDITNSPFVPAVNVNNEVTASTSLKNDRTDETISIVAPAEPTSGSEATTKAINSEAEVETNPDIANIDSSSNQLPISSDQTDSSKPLASNATPVQSDKPIEATNSTPLEISSASAATAENPTETVGNTEIIGSPIEQSVAHTTGSDITAGSEIPIESVNAPDEAASPPAVPSNTIEHNVITETESISNVQIEETETSPASDGHTESGQTPNVQSSVVESHSSGTVGIIETGEIPNEFENNKNPQVSPSIVTSPSETSPHETSGPTEAGSSPPTPNLHGNDGLIGTGNNPTDPALNEPPASLTVSGNDKLSETENTINQSPTDENASIGSSTTYNKPETGNPIVSETAEQIEIVNSLNEPSSVINPSEIPIDNPTKINGPASDTNPQSETINTSVPDIHSENNGPIDESNSPNRPSNEASSASIPSANPQDFHLPEAFNPSVVPSAAANIPNAPLEPSNQLPSSSNIPSVGPESVSNPNEHSAGPNTPSIINVDVPPASNLPTENEAKVPGPSTASNPSQVPQESSSATGNTISELSTDGSDGNINPSNNPSASNIAPVPSGIPTAVNPPSKPLEPSPGPVVHLPPTAEPISDSSLNKPTSNPSNSPIHIPGTSGEFERFQCPSSGLFPHPKNCHVYFACKNSIVFGLREFQIKCPESMVFDPTTLECTANQSACVEPQIVCTQEGRQSDPNDPGRYHICKLGFFGEWLSLSSQCSYGRVFNSITQSCINSGESGIQQVLKHIEKEEKKRKETEAKELRKQQQAQEQEAKRQQAAADREAKAHEKELKAQQQAVAREQRELNKIRELEIKSLKKQQEAEEKMLKKQREAEEKAAKKQTAKVNDSNESSESSEQ